ncbi:MAG: UDP-glucose 4-epimerase [Pseudonocardiales bacterium]|nr:MAG: UDP-glucose 4-epimerase [Pseudonocardiales bacterium]
MRAVVTGGAGFIGSNIVDGLVRSGAEVLVLDDLSRGSRLYLCAAVAAGARLERIDIRDGAAVLTTVTGFAPDVLFHLAAQIDVRVSMARPAYDAAVNVVGSVNVFAAAVAAGVRRVVNTSTGGAIYGDTTVVPTPETEPARPLSAYGLSKRTVEEYGAWFRSAHDLDVVTLRYGNVYGPRQDPTGDAGVVALFCDRVLGGARPTVFGDGTQTRDYVFVDDVVAANLAAAAAPVLRHDRYNIGTGLEVSVLELVGAVATAAGAVPENFTPEFRPARTGEVPRSCLDVSRARTELDLPDSTSLAAGLRSTLGWVRTLRE